MRTTVSDFMQQKISPCADMKLYTRLGLYKAVQSWDWPPEKKRAFTEFYVWRAPDLSEEEIEDLYSRGYIKNKEAIS